eukprot:GILK01014741.1.p1 GENE.GILK01014741.1~~GILK01014741.1.p1  ORF type:complete len:228 (-),score=37.95 GILK01014741.1:238-894(-)
MEEAQIESYLLVHNISKNHNWGNLVRSASAFGVKQVCVVGQKKVNLFGNKGAANRSNFRTFNSLEEAQQFFRSRNVSICGVEIMETALPIQSHPFRGSTAFILGNEGMGLTPKQIAICDHFVYIPQYGTGTASLNVTVAGSIVMHHFAVWAGFKEHERSGHKFIVDASTQKDRWELRDEEDKQLEDTIRAERKEKKQTDWTNDTDDMASGDLFHLEES